MTNSVVAEQAVDELRPKTGKRERSGIDFPYNSLDDAVVLAKAVQRLGGNQCRLESLAAELGHDTVNSGGFLQKVASARIFGLSSRTQGVVNLTPLGGRIIDPEQEKSAKIDAFLNVPLYKAIYEEFKSGTLPPSGGLEAKMVSLGVPEKQKERARQAFQRSAKDAGFFAYGSSKLVYPAIGTVNESQKSKETDETPDEPKSKNGNGGGEGGGQHPLIEGLIKALPKSGDRWPMEARRKWLQAAAMNFDYVYTDPESDTTLIKVTLDRERSAN
jgi:hypothetical protein